MIRINGQTWIILKEADHGFIAALVAEGKSTERRGYFPWSTIEDKSESHCDLDEGARG